MPADELAAADALIDLVRSNPPPGGIRGDTGEAIMFGTYVRAFRRFIRIRDLARDDAGDEAMILARSLLSMIARAIWVDLPTEGTERRARFERWKKRTLTDEAREARGLQSAGFEIDFDFEDNQAALDRLEHVSAMPSDYDLLVSLRLVAYYERIYRSGSSTFTTHCTMRSTN